MTIKENVYVIKSVGAFTSGAVEITEEAVLSHLDSGNLQTISGFYSESATLTNFVEGTASFDGYFLSGTRKGAYAAKEYLESNNLTLMESKTPAALIRDFLTNDVSRQVATKALVAEIVEYSLRDCNIKKKGILDLTYVVEPTLNKIRAFYEVVEDPNKALLAGLFDSPDVFDKDTFATSISLQPYSEFQDIANYEKYLFLRILSALRATSSVANQNDLAAMFK